MGTPDKHEPFSFIRLGMMAEFAGKRYQVIARTRWRQRYKEYWREDGESGYSNEVWIYDEWLLIDEDRIYFYLVEDKEGYWVAREIIPEKPTLLPRSLRMSFFHNQPEQRVQEYGGAEVIYFEGESNYHITKGDRIHFSSFLHNGVSYSAEWRMLSENEIKEIEFFEERPLSRRKAAEAFGDNEVMQELKEKAAGWNFVYQVARAAMFIFLAMVIWSCARSGEVVSRQQVPVQTVLQQEGFVSDPLPMDEEELYRLEISARNLGNNSELYVFAYLLDASRAAINTMDGNFFYYTGYDSDGQWTESSLETDKRFRVKEPDGPYYLQLFADTGDLPAATLTGTFTITLYEGVRMTRYFFVAFLIALVVFMWTSGRRNYSRLARM